MSGVWKRSYGRPTKAPPDERGGNRHGRPNATAPHPDSTHSGRPQVGRLPLTTGPRAAPTGPRAGKSAIVVVREDEPGTRVLRAGGAAGNDRGDKRAAASRRTRAVSVRYPATASFLPALLLSNQPDGAVDAASVPSTRWQRAALR